MAYDKNTVKLLIVLFLQGTYVVLLAYNDRSNPYLAGTLVFNTLLIDLLLSEFNFEING